MFSIYIFPQSSSIFIIIYVSYIRLLSVLHSFMCLSVLLTLYVIIRPTHLIILFDFFSLIFYFYISSFNKYFSKMWYNLLSLDITVRSNTYLREAGCIQTSRFCFSFSDHHQHLHHWHGLHSLELYWSR